MSTRDIILNKWGILIIQYKGDKSMNDIHKDVEILADIKDVLSKMYKIAVDSSTEKAVDDAIDICIGKAIASMYDVGTSDDKIIQSLNKFWGINFGEAQDRLNYEKRQTVLRDIREYLRKQGYSKEKIQNFLMDNKVFIKIKKCEIWETRRSPEELIKMVQE